MTRKSIVYIATSADGYIARLDGSVDWLDRPRTAGDYDMTEFQSSVDTIIYGRRTFDESVARFFGGDASKVVRRKSRIMNYVVTHRPQQGMPGLEFVTEPLAEFVARLRAQPGKNIWIMGGGGLIASLLEVGGIDEFMIHVIPTFIGSGIPLVAPGISDVQLELLESKSWSDGVTKLHYRVLPREQKQKSGAKKRASPAAPKPSKKGKIRRR
jgi:dihydrofolate reductase